MAAYWVIEVAYQGFDPDLDNKLENLMGSRTGSGSGFGYRDIDWTFTHEETAMEKLAILREFSKTSKRGLTVSITEHDDEEDE